MAVSIVLKMLTMTVGLMDVIIEAPRILSFGLAIPALLTIPLAIWQLVGIWRSAGRNIDEQRRLGRATPWSIIARGVAVLGFLAVFAPALITKVPNGWANLRIAFWGDPTPHHTLHLLNGGTELEIAGGIDFGTAADFQKLLDASATIRTVDLNSTGGWVAEAQKIRDVIRLRHLATYTAATCASACTVIFMGGYPRYLGPGGRLGFHRYTFPGLSEEEDADVNRRGQLDLVKSGVEPAFAVRAFSTPSSSMWAPDKATLVSAHVVTQLVDGMSFSSAALEESVTREKVDTELSSTSLFSALKRADPDAYAMAIDAVANGIGQGKTLAEVIAAARLTIFPAADRFRLVTPDDVQMEIAAMMAEDATLLTATHPSACTAILSASSADTVNLWKFLPQEVQVRRSTLLGRILQEGSIRPSLNVATRAEARAAFAELWGRVASHGIDTSMVGRDPGTLEEQRSLCSSYAAFLTLMSELPPQQAGPLMRYLLKSG